MTAIRHRVGIKASPEKVYQALSTIEGLSGWWTDHTTGVSRAGQNIVFRFFSLDKEELGSMTMEVKLLEPNAKVEWLCKEGPAEWIGTTIVFDLSQQDDYTIVLFGHNNWKEPVPFMYHCSMKWAIFLMSLKELLETGKGRPSPHDTKIDNWN